VVDIPLNSIQCDSLLILDYRIGLVYRNRMEKFRHLEDTVLVPTMSHFLFVNIHKLYRGADKSLARPD